MKIIFAQALVMLTLSSQVSADLSWGPLEKLQGIEVSSGVFLSSPSYSTCGSIQAQVSVTDQKLANQIYSLAITAYTLEKPVTLLTDGCNGPYYRVYGIKLGN